MKGKTMKIQDFLKQRGVEFELLEHRPTYDSQRMAQAVHVSGYHVAKTVMVRVDPGTRYVVAVLPATHAINFDALKRTLGSTHVELATEIEIARQCPDCEIGALPPFGSQYGMQTVVDSELTHDDFIVFEGSTHSEAIRMKYADFHQLEDPKAASFAAVAVSAAK
jgi:Ala-tRNA(Pro) deacylase